MIILCTGGRHPSFNKDWTVLTKKEELPETFDEPEIVYSIHWHWKIPESIWKANICVGFHSTDLPFGRGAAPIERLQHLNFAETMLTAFLVDGGWDTGVILMKRPLSLEGNKQEILSRAYATCAEMITYIEEHGFPMYIPQELYVCGY